MNNRMKKELLQTLLKHSFPWVSVDLTYPGVEVPPHLQGQEAVAFKLAFESGPQIPDLKLTDEGWSGTLSFKGNLYFVKIPWGACAQFTNQENYVVAFHREEPVATSSSTATTVKDLPPVDAQVPATTSEPPKRKFGVIRGGGEKN